MRARNKPRPHLAAPSKKDVDTLLELFSAGNATNLESEARSFLMRYPHHLFGHKALVASLTMQGKLDEALITINAALKKFPGETELHNNRAAALIQKIRFEEAVASADNAIRLKPDNSDAYANKGLALNRMGFWRPALMAYQKAIELNPNDFKALNNAGVVLMNLKMPEQAVHCFEAASAVNPDYRDARMHLALAKKDLELTKEARITLEQMLVENPDDDEARSQLFHLVRSNCEFDQAETDGNKLLSRLKTNSIGNIYAFNILALENATLEDHLRAGQRQAEASVAYLLKVQLPTNLKPQSSEDRPLRIGYLSADFILHATSILLAGVLEAHDRNRVEIFAYSISPSDGSPMRQRLEAACSMFRDISALSFTEAAQQITADQIDILVDLKGYTKDARLEITALRPAPLIVSWLGYPASLGHPLLADYLIGDPVVTPLEHQQYYSETLALMPNCYQPNDNRRPLYVRPGRAEHGLPEDRLVFCSFNQSYKITLLVFSQWCRTLAEVPDSVLWLLINQEEARTNLRLKASELGIDPDRIVFAKSVSVEDHMTRLQLADIALDTFPYGSHTTGSDALWSGVPLIAIKGETFASRVSSSLLRSVGLDELIADSPVTAADLAIALAKDRARLDAIRGKLISSRSSAPLFDTQQFTFDLERLYQKIWQQSVEGIRAPIKLEPEARAPSTGKPTISVAEQKPSLPASLPGTVASEPQGNKQLSMSKTQQASVLAMNGRALQQAGDKDAALAAFKSALEIVPGDLLVQCNAGLILLELDRPQEAIGHFEAALAISPDFEDAAESLFYARFKAASKALHNARHEHENLLANAPDRDQIRTSLLDIIKSEADFSATGAHESLLLQRIRHEQLKEGIKVFSLLSMESATPDDQLNAARQAANLSYGASLSLPPCHSPVAMNTHRGSLRIAYLSADFHNHATSVLLAGVMEHHDTKKVEVFCYSNGQDDGSPLRQRIVKASRQFRDIRNLDAEAAARMIAADGIDILIDLKGYTKGNRLDICALRPAPIIANWLGYPGTIGHPRLADYIIGDSTVTPLKHQHHFSETLALMPHCYQPNDDLRAIGPRPSREDCGLPEDAFVFCSFNHAYKLTANVFAQWCLLLKERPDSVLWLLGEYEQTENNLYAFAERKGVAASRLIFAPRIEITGHLGRLQNADLALDTFPYGSHTTASDLLWSGVPLIAIQGDTFASRVSSSLLTNVGLPELITDSPEAATRLALELARDGDRLARLKSKLMANRVRSHLFNTRQFAGDLERLYLKMWEQHDVDPKQPIVLTDV